MSPELSHQAVQELLGAFALDAVSEEERGAVETHLAGCPRCRAEVAQHLETAAMLASGGARAPDGMWDSISESLAEGPRADIGVVQTRSHLAEQGRDQPWRWITGAVAAAAVAAAVSLGVVVTEQQDRIDRLAADVERSELAGAAAAASLNPDAQRIALASDDGAVRVDAVILPDGRGYLVEDNLEALPAGKTYQLWTLGQEEPVSAGLLGRDPGIVAFAASPEATGLAITVERAGGVVASRSPPAASGEVHTA